MMTVAANGYALGLPGDRLEEHEIKHGNYG